MGKPRAAAQAAQCWTRTESNLAAAAGGFGFPRHSVIKNPPAIAGYSGPILGQEDSREKERATSPVFLSGKSRARGIWSLVSLQSLNAVAESYD